MATNKDLLAQNETILKAIEELTNGAGIGGLRNDVKVLSEKFDALASDVHKIKEQGFNEEDSLRNRVNDLEKEVQYLKDKLKSKSELWSKAWLHILLVGLGFLTIFVLERLIS